MKPIMKQLLCSAALAAALIPAAMPAQATDVGVSISVGEPGFYGRIDIGDFPQPVLVYPRPVIIRPAPVAVTAAPIYLRVPPGHAKNWRKHCARYDACGQPVYFVQDRWYNSVYVPEYRHRNGDRGEHHGKGKGHRDD